MRNNRRAGSQYERDVVAILRDSGLFPHAVTSRSCNRARDGEKVDIVNRDESLHGRMEYNIQCKSFHERPNYHELLKSMPSLEGIINVIFHRYTRRAEKLIRKQGEYALLKQEDFISLMRFRKGYELLETLLEMQDDETYKEYRKLLATIGL